MSFRLQFTQGKSTLFMICILAVVVAGWINTSSVGIFSRENPEGIFQAHVDLAFKYTQMGNYEKAKRKLKILDGLASNYIVVDDALYDARINGLTNLGVPSLKSGFPKGLFQ
jgi:hypothetical protein